MWWLDDTHVTRKSLGFLDLFTAPVLEMKDRDIIRLRILKALKLKLFIVKLQVEYWFLISVPPLCSRLTNAKTVYRNPGKDSWFEVLEQFLHRFLLLHGAHISPSRWIIQYWADTVGSINKYENMLFCLETPISECYVY